MLASPDPLLSPWGLSTINLLGLGHTRSYFDNKDAREGTEPGLESLNRRLLYSAALRIIPSELAWFCARLHC
jgi:hypothetical protein